MFDVDRFFVAAAVRRQLLDDSAWRRLIDDWNSAGEETLVDYIARRQVIDSKEIDAFRRMVRRVVDENPAAADDRLRQLADETVRAALTISKDPTVAAFLAGKLRGAGQSINGCSYFRMVSSLGVRGNGAYWRAHDLMLDRPVALKELRHDYQNDPEQRAAFLREAQITGRLQHPGIVPIYRLEGGKGDSDVFYAMRMLEGRTLAAMATRFHQDRVRGKVDILAFMQLIAAFESTCQAMSYSHSKGVVHLGLKPAIVMLGDFGEAIILNWGYAEEIESVTKPEKPLSESTLELLCLKPADSDVLRDGKTLGTPEYMAPEQAAGGEAGVASDIYSLGGILFTLLTGETPHRWPAGAEASEVLRRIAEVRPPRAREVAPWASPALDAVCAKAMQRDPHDRYPTVANLLADIQCWSAGEPVSVYSERWPRRAFRWTMRNKGIVAATGGVLVTILFVAALALGSEWASAQNGISVRLERLSDFSESIADNTRYILRVRAESAHFLGDSPDIEGLLLALRRDDTVRAEYLRSQAIRTLTNFLETRNTLHTFSILDARSKKEVLRVSGPISDPGSKSIVRVETPALASSAIDDILLHASRLKQSYTYSDPLRPVLRDGMIVEGQLPGSRTCGAIVNDAGDFLGALVDECTIVPTLVNARFATRQETAAITSFMADERGNVLYYSLAPGFTLPAPPRPADPLTRIFPELSPLFDPRNEGEPWRSVRRSLPTNQSVFATKVNFDYRQPERTFIYCSAISRRPVIAAAENRVAAILSGVGVAVAFCLAIAWRIARGRAAA